jgi:hypothetical protein
MEDMAACILVVCSFKLIPVDRLWLPFPFRCPSKRSIGIEEPPPVQTAALHRQPTAAPTLEEKLAITTLWVIQPEVK